jgi:BirA family biotin operon repressor/biotin-[acetyl-CoA-carboxylase] ligase
MNKDQLMEEYSSLRLGGIRYFDSIGSTNDEAMAWAAQEAADLSLVIADEQTAGRGRANRKWFTPPNSALAFSLILRPTASEIKYPTRITGLGALALTESLHLPALNPQIKWPNDVLINGRKVAGILVESKWLGTTLDASIIGMGVNVLKASTPPAESVTFPATSIEAELGHALDRIELLKEILSRILEWRNKLGREEFIEAWEKSLAFREQQVQISMDGQTTLIGELVGLESNGKLQIRNKAGETREIPFGEIQLRPVL